MSGSAATPRAVQLELGTRTLSLVESAMLIAEEYEAASPADFALVAELLDPAPPLVAEPKLRACEYVVVDVETTGGSIRYGHRITEVAAVCIDGQGNLLEEFRTLVNPGRPIPRFVTALTNITNDMVRDAPRFDDIAPQLIRILENRIFVAHNAMFDLQFVGSELVFSTGYVFEPRVLCTMKLARKLVPEVSSRSLDSLCYFFGFENEARHRAYGDALVTTDLLRRLLNRLDEHEVEDWPALQEFLKKRRRRRRKRRANPQSIESV
jgi:DNA polymerase III epsilon subunit family exonuclease